MARGKLELSAVAVAAAFFGALWPGCQADSGVTPDGDADADEAVDAPFDAEADVEVVPVVCDVVADEGCGEGESCVTMVRSGIETEVGCVPRRPEEELAAPGMPCTFDTEDGVHTTHDCPPAHACMVVSALGPPRCLRLCSEDDPSVCTGAYAGVEDARPDGACALGIGSSPGLAAVRACMMMHDCDPRCADCPSRYDACIPVVDSLRVGFGCFAYIPDETGDGRTGDPCSYINNCRPGYGCYQADSTSGERECRPACDLDGVLDESRCPFARCGAHEGDEEGSCTVVPELRVVMPGLGLCMEE